jgi:hypothetical protein
VVGDAVVGLGFARLRDPRHVPDIFRHLTNSCIAEGDAVSVAGQENLNSYNALDKLCRTQPPDMRKRCM